MLIFILCLQKQKKKKEKERDTKVNLHCEKRRNEKLKKMQTKEVHNEVSNNQDQNEGRWAKKMSYAQVMCSTSLLDSLLYPCIFSFLTYLSNNPSTTFIKDLMIHVHYMT